MGRHFLNPVMLMHECSDLHISDICFDGGLVKRALLKYERPNTTQAVFPIIAILAMNWKCQQTPQNRICCVWMGINHPMQASTSHSSLLLGGLACKGHESFCWKALGVDSVGRMWGNLSPANSQPTNSVTSCNKELWSGLFHCKPPFSFYTFFCFWFLQITESHVCKTAKMTRLMPLSKWKCWFLSLRTLSCPWSLPFINSLSQASSSLQRHFDSLCIEMKNHRIISDRLIELGVLAVSGLGTGLLCSKTIHIKMSVWWPQITFAVIYALGSG